MSKIGANALVIQFAARYDVKTMATLQAAIKEAIQMLYQLEPGELATEALPSRDDRRLIFLYESAEGGAGVLRQAVEDPKALPRIAAEALRLCHFDPETGEDHGHEAGNGQGCEAGCYDCILDYGNQLDHRFLDRKLALDALRAIAGANVVVGAGGLSRTQQLQRLWDRCDSALERRWLKFIDERRLKVPSDGQYLIASCMTRPDFYYADSKAAIYVDGPPHDDPQQKQKDHEVTDRLIEAGFLVVRFHHQADWAEIVKQYKDVFGA